MVVLAFMSAARSAEDYDCTRGVVGIELCGEFRRELIIQSTFRISYDSPNWVHGIGVRMENEGEITFFIPPGQGYRVRKAAARTIEILIRFLLAT